MRILTCLLLTTATSLSGFSGMSQGAVRHYTATVSDSKWTLFADTRLTCGLSHKIPRYGQVMFSAVASKQLNLDFEMDMLRLPANYSLASVTSVAPAWKPGVPTKSITDMQMKKQFNSEIPEKAAWTMLSELEKGFMPTFYYADFHSPFDKVAVGLSAIDFADNYEKFLSCVDNLLPYSFDDIAYTILNYQQNSDELSKASKKRLSLIGEYMKQDKDIEEVLLNAYADSHGGRWTNQKISEKRANKIKSYFTAMGIDESRIVVNGYGEKRHAASNKTELGRMTNRRVVIQMAKP
jgi:outer membrane protein OmpA-like peptidoglycan-associated protein